MAVGKLTQIYPSTSRFTTSTFKLEDDIIKIQLVGLQETDCVCVETVVGTGDCDEKYIPYSPDCSGQLCYGYPQGQFFLNVPGRYRLVLSNRLDKHLTDPSWFENVEIFQTPVDGKNINLEEGNCGMGCSQKIECDPLGIKIDGVLCAAPNKHVDSVIAATQGWNLLMNDAQVISIPLTSPDETITVVGSTVVVNPVKAAEKIAADEDATTALSVGICANEDAKTNLVTCLTTTICQQATLAKNLADCLPSNVTAANVCGVLATFPLSTTLIGG